MSDQFESWTKLLALAQANKTKGALREAIVAAGIKIVEDEPLSGYYRCAAVKDGPLLPVAIWRDGETLYVMRNGEPVPPPRVWPYCVWSPIPYEWYEAAVEHGAKWPDSAVEVAETRPTTAVVETTATGTAASSTPVPSASVTATDGIEDEATKLKREIDGKITASKARKAISSDEEAASAQSMRSDLNALSTKADKKREALVRPLLDKQKEINGTWMPLVKSAKDEADAIRKDLSAWETKKYVAEQEAMKAAAAAAAAAQPPAPVVPLAPAADGAVPINHNQPVEQPPAPVVPLAPASPPVTHIKGATGRAAKVNTIKTAVIVDQDAVYQHLKKVPEIGAALLKVAQRMVDAGHTVPGVEVNEERSVA